jgi:hypothetical protein
VRALMIADPMTYAVSAVRRGLYGGALPAGLLPSWSSAPLELAVTGAFAILSLALATLLCRRRA